MTHGPALVCPACRAELDIGPGGSHRCGPCRRSYPEVAGIPDLRLTSDRYLTLDEDRAKAERLASFEDATFAELVAEYWRMTPEVPPALAARYAATALDGVARGERWMAESGRPEPGSSMLDIGCGTGGLLVAAARAGAAVTGVDIALRWLVIARRRCEEEDVAVRLVAADGALLPFRHGSFDRTVSFQVLEYAADQPGLLQSSLLAARPGGEVRLVAANRFSLAPDPAVGLYGTGYLPRRMAVWYVARRRNTRYHHVRPLSVGGVRALVGLRSDVIVRAGPLPPPPSWASPRRLMAQAAYDRLRRRPIANSLLMRVGPLLEAAGHVDRPVRPR
ncbi:MAG: methyltransferase domain-containing protein [Acidimicrobiales bacterium]